MRLILTSLLATTMLSIPAPAQAAAACDGRTATIVATRDQQFVSGTEGDDVIAGGGFRGLDIQAGGGNDVVCALLGNNRIEVGSGDNVVYGGPGKDLFFGGAGHDRMVGGGGQDSFVGSPGGDDYAGDGDDLLGYAGAFPADAGGVRIDAIARVVEGGGGRDTFTGIDRFYGTWDADTFLGSDRDEEFEGGGQGANPAGQVDHAFGGDGDDTLSVVEGGIAEGGAGDDVLMVISGGTGDGGAGDDTILTYVDTEEWSEGIPHAINGGPGRDRVQMRTGGEEGDPAAWTGAITGGAGRDTMDFHWVGKVVVRLGSGRARWGLSHGRVREFERVVGSTRDDVIIGSSRGERLLGGRGNDVLEGRGGKDSVVGGQGRDRCRGERRTSCER